MPGRLRQMAGQGSALFTQLQGLLKGTDPKEIEAIVDDVGEMTDWVEKTIEVLKKEDAITKMMVLLNAGVRIVELIEPLVDLIEGDDDSSEVPSWIAVLIPLIKRLRASIGEQND